MSFFVKCPKQRPIQGRFKKVQVYGAIENKGTLLCTILKRPTPVNAEARPGATYLLESIATAVYGYLFILYNSLSNQVWARGITKKDIHMLLT